MAANPGMNGGPLVGIKVLDLSNVGPGARCARMLADFGASVTRIVPPARKGGHRIEAPYHAYGGGRGWLKVVLDMKAEPGRELFFQLAAQADVVVESFRPGVAARLGIDYDAVARVNPRIVYCAISGYGQTGPAAGWVGHDLNYDALAGMLATTECRIDGAPAMPGLTVADTAGGGMQAVLAILAALVGRTATGKGTYLDVSMTDGVLYLMSMHVDEYLATGKEPGPGSSLLTGGYACYDLYRTADDRWLTLAAVESGFFANVCKALDCEQWIAQQMDPAAQASIRDAFRAGFARRTRAEWMAVFSQLDSCVTPVNSIAEVVDDPQFQARGAFIDVEHPEHGRYRQLGPLLAGAAPVTGTVKLPSGSATDTEAVLAEIGVDANQYRALAAAGIVG
ncbi:MAG TPA: CaiB/BaiF CoA-transferase family protein [Ferrovibrio sp.]|uniref:CaiB/BaiF CoA transferase family protein n=1 Tax=Ferrovibrio sp. TaxID=1917215 RepID=UPI002B4B3278|nr:CaiB/BaiF CoA-transferase family protein [Ferrovibrio sp.]HLT77379.1 CaiB/BaiF CoA-transferase family protein [Ferrovibrio sp.]